STPAAFSSCTGTGTSPSSSPRSTKRSLPRSARSRVANLTPASETLWRIGSVCHGGGPGPQLAVVALPRGPSQLFRRPTRAVTFAAHPSGHVAPHHGAGLRRWWGEICPGVGESDNGRKAGGRR